jgi:hypothetical protein
MSCATSDEPAQEGKVMNSKRFIRGFTVFVMIAATLAGGSGRVLAQDDKITKPDPEVPEIFTILGEFVRVAYNNEGYVTLGYRIAQESVGDEWMLLEVGMTVRTGSDNQVVKRDAVSLRTPDGGSVPLATQKEYSKARLNAPDLKANRVRDSINYFPAIADTPCRIGFFTDA